MQVLQKSYTKAILIGSILAVAATLISLFVYKPEECPAGYTQQQVDTTGCYIGAMIGPSWLWPLAIGVIIELVTLAVAAVLYFVAHNKAH